jgi:hypothetical protein
MQIVVANTLGQHGPTCLRIGGVDGIYGNVHSVTCKASMCGSASIPTSRPNLNPYSSESRRPIAVHQAVANSSCHQLRRAGDRMRQPLICEVMVRNYRLLTLASMSSPTID